MEPVHRLIQIDAEQHSPEDFKINARLSDNYHEMSVSIVARGDDLTIRSISASMVRFPTERCKKALGNIQALEGLRLGKGFTKPMLNLVGGPKGCTHINNLILQINAASILYKPLRDCSEEERFARLKNACIAYRVDES